MLYEQCCVISFDILFLMYREQFFFKIIFFFTLAENSKLRHVEKDVLIPQIMRDRAKELCSDKVQGKSQIFIRRSDVLTFVP